MYKTIQTTKIYEPRRTKVKVGPYDVNYIHRRPPWVAAWWSAALPGLGQIHLGHYLKGLLLMSGEIMLNALSNLNLSIYNSMIGNFEKVHEVINYNWLTLYCVVLVFAVWDAYRGTIDQNKSCRVEEKQYEREFTFAIIHTWGMNSLNRIDPRMAFFWSLIFSGLFHICNNKLISGVTLMGWMVIISYQTKIPEMIIYTVLGQFELIPSLINPQWLLFFPSVYLFSIYDGYAHSVYYNNLFAEEQAYYFGRRFGGNKLKLG